jgi:hypothetical protein
MDIKPVSQIDVPAYPTQEDLADRKTLQQNLPRRWRKAHGLAGAVALFMAANTAGCGEPSNPPQSSVAIDCSGRLFTSEVVAEADGWIRSIFRKPQPRRVMMGCIAIMPPAVLHEDAAVKAVQDVGQTP